MYRLIKTSKDGSLEDVIAANVSEDIILDKLVKYVVEHASNGEEYTSSDLEAVRDSQSEGIGDYVIYVDHVNTLADDQLVLKGGGVCAHCHSDNVEASVPEMNEGYISRKLTCNVCNNATVEAYVFIGMEE